VKLRYFAGMSNEEIAELLGVSLSTVKNHGFFSKAWLFREIEGREARRGGVRPRTAHPVKNSLTSFGFLVLKFRLPQ